MQVQKQQPAQIQFNKPKPKYCLLLMMLPSNSCNLFLINLIKHDETKNRYHNISHQSLRLSRIKQINEILISQIYQ